MNHSNYLEEAVRLSREGMRRNAGGPFGCVVVLNDNIISHACNEVVASNDPTAHAEIVAIRRACAALGTFRLEDCDIYASCEPCPMCLAAIYWAHARRIFYANSHHDAASIGFADAAFYGQLAIPPAQRTVPMIQLPRDDALEVFAEWRQKPDKILY